MQKKWLKEDANKSKVKTVEGDEGLARGMDWLMFRGLKTWD